MKLNKYFLIGAMGLGLFACSDDLDGNGQDNGNKVQEGTTYAAFTLKFGNSVNSRAGELPTPPDYDTENEEGNEGYVNKVRIIVTNENGVVEANKEFIETTPVNNVKSTKHVFEITPGVKKFYAYVNNDDASLNAAIGSTWDATKQITKKASELGEYEAVAENDTPTKFFAMSSTEVVTRTIEADVTEEQAKAEKATKNQVELDVERMVAKVTVQLADALVAENGFGQQAFTVESLTAQIGNADNLKYDGTEYTNTASYLIAYNENDVRKTPYYEWPDDAVSWTGFAQSNLLSGTTSTSIYAPNETTKNPKARFYCLENTHAGAGNYLQSNTTFVRVVAKMRPNSVVEFKYTATSGTEGQEGYTPEKVELSAGTAPTSASTFYRILDTADGKNIGTYVMATNLLELYGENGITNEAIDNSITDTDEQNAAKVVKVIDALTAKGYSFSAPYKDGEGNYNVWVNDMKEANGTYMNIAPVFRNDWYELTINGITLPGDPEPDIDPDQPIHPTTWMAITLTVRNWNRVSHDIKLQ